MNDEQLESPSDSENRRKTRYFYEHHLDLSFEGQDYHADVVDWSENGIQVYVAESLAIQLGFQATFTIHRMSFVPDEEFEDEEAIPPVEDWSLSGEVMWGRPKDEGITLGVRFEGSLDGVPFPDLPEFLTDADLCELIISKPA